MYAYPIKDYRLRLILRVLLYFSMEEFIHGRVSNLSLIKNSYDLRYFFILLELSIVNKIF